MKRNKRTHTHTVATITHLPKRIFIISSSPCSVLPLPPTEFTVYTHRRIWWKTSIIKYHLMFFGANKNNETFFHLILSFVRIYTKTSVFSAISNNRIQTKNHFWRRTRNAIAQWKCSDMRIPMRIFCLHRQITNKITEKSKKSIHISRFFLSRHWLDLTHTCNLAQIISAFGHLIVTRRLIIKMNK